MYHFSSIAKLHLSEDLKRTVNDLDRRGQLDKAALDNVLTIGGAFLRYFIQDRIPPYYVLSVSGGCSIMPYIAGGAAGDPAVWIRKKGATDTTYYPPKDSYHQFAVPKTLQKQFLDVAKPYHDAIKQSQSKGN